MIALRVCESTRKATQEMNMICVAGHLTHRPVTLTIRVDVVSMGGGMARLPLRTLLSVSLLGGEKLSVKLVW